jgi:hypothetical protein
LGEVLNVLKCVKNCVKDLRIKCLYYENYGALYENNVVK